MSDEWDANESALPHEGTSVLGHQDTAEQTASYINGLGIRRRENYRTLTPLPPPGYRWGLHCKLVPESE